MPHQTSAVYHLDFAGRIPPGRTLGVEDHKGGTADIFLHPLHAREPLVWGLNWVTRHQVGYGLWRQRWTDDERMKRAARGLGVAVSRWEIVPRREMPRDRYVFPVEQEGSCIWLIRSGCCTVDLRDDMNVMLERIAGDGLWEQAWRQGQKPGGAVPTPVLTPSVLSLPI